MFWCVNFVKLGFCCRKVHKLENFRKFGIFPCGQKFNIFLCVLNCILVVQTAKRHNGKNELMVICTSVLLKI